MGNKMGYIKVDRSMYSHKIERIREVEMELLRGIIKEERREDREDKKEYLQKYKRAEETRKKIEDWLDNDYTNWLDREQPILRRLMELVDEEMKWKYPDVHYNKQVSLDRESIRNNTENMIEV